MPLLLLVLSVAILTVVSVLAIAIAYNLITSIIRDYRDDLGETPRQYYGREEQFRQGPYGKHNI